MQVSMTVNGKAITGADASLARADRSVGVMRTASISSGRDWEICQFWQKRQERQHPAVATEQAREPGRK